MKSAKYPTAVSTAFQGFIEGQKSRFAIQINRLNGLTTWEDSHVTTFLFTLLDSSDLGHVES